MILITGATGNNGLEILKRLATKNRPVRAMVRARNRATVINALPNIEIVERDFDHPETLLKALAGVEQAFTPSLNNWRSSRQLSKVELNTLLSSHSTQLMLILRYAICATMQQLKLQFKPLECLILFYVLTCLCRAC